MVVIKIDEGSDDLVKLASAAKIRVGKAALQVAQEAVQLHGGIGITDELDIAHYFKRLTVINQTFGTPDYHLARYIA